jgi:hypothetical protein
VPTLRSTESSCDTANKQRQRIIAQSFAKMAALIWDPSCALQRKNAKGASIPMGRFATQAGCCERRPAASGCVE